MAMKNEDDDNLGNTDDPLTWEYNDLCRFGCCPRCHVIASGTFDCGQVRYAYCKQCKVCWFVESGMLVSAGYPEQQQARYDEIGAAEFEDVDGGWWPPETER
jgi:hypothetical protein